MLLIDKPMPATCDECPCYNELHDRCNINNGDLRNISTWNNKPVWCHLIEVEAKEKEGEKKNVDC